MHWKHRENNVKNCINIDLKCLIDFALRMEFSKLFDSLTQKGNLLFCKKIPLSCFYLQLEFDNYKHNCQPLVLSQILQRKTLYQVSFDLNFLEIYWLIESKVFSVIATNQVEAAIHRSCNE